MNKTLIIYDLDGTIIQQIAGFYKIPNGLPYLEVEIPINKYVSGVDVETQEAIFEDVPKSENDIMKEKISILEAENADLLLDSAIKDMKLKSIEKDLADLTLEVVMGGM